MLDTLVILTLILGFVACVVSSQVLSAKPSAFAVTIMPTVRWA